MAGNRKQSDRAIRVPKMDDATRERLTREHIKQAKNGDRNAVELIIQSHIRLVYGIARRYNATRLDFDDLVQEGLLGMIRAIERFDLGRMHGNTPIRFSTYAVTWIRQGIVRAVENQDQFVRAPAYVVDHAMIIKRVSDILLYELGRPPTDAEIMNRAQMSEIAFDRAQSRPAEPTSLNAPLNQDAASDTIADVVRNPIPELFDPELIVLQRLALAKITDAIDTILSDNERIVIRARFGLDSGAPTTLEGIRSQIAGGRGNPNVSREGVRHIESRAIRKLKKHLRADEIFEP